MDTERPRDMDRATKTDCRRCVRYDPPGPLGPLELDCSVVAAISGGPENEGVGTVSSGHAIAGNGSVYLDILIVVE